MAWPPKVPPQRAPAPHQAAARRDGYSHELSEHDISEPSRGPASLPKELPVRSKPALQRHLLRCGRALAMAVLEDHQLLAHAHLRELGRADLESVTSVPVPQPPHFMAPRPHHLAG
jgi:hypothetical protein